MYYLSYNEEDITGFYNDAIHKSIPINSILITDEDWTRISSNSSLHKVDKVTKTIFQLPSPPSIPQPLPQPDWSSLTNNLRGSMLFGKTYGMASQDTRVNAAFTVLLACVNSASPNLDDLQFALTQLVLLLPDILSTDDIDNLNNLLISNNFPFTI